MLAARVRPRVTEIRELGETVLRAGSLGASIKAVTLRVLVVDDHESFRRLAQRLLRAGGYDVVGLAAGGAEAVRQATLLRPDLVLLDVVLPDLDGFGVAELLAGLVDPPVVVLVSSRTRAELGTRLDTAPVRGFVPKEELTLQRLAEAIR